MKKVDTTNKCKKIDNLQNILYDALQYSLECDINVSNVVGNNIVRCIEELSELAWYDEIGASENGYYVRENSATYQ